MYSVGHAKKWQAQEYPSNWGWFNAQPFPNEDALLSGKNQHFWQRSHLGNSGGFLGFFEERFCEDESHCKGNNHQGQFPCPFGFFNNRIFIRDGSDYT